jgi:hypothetical protein
LLALSLQGLPTDFQQSKLKAGHGPEVVLWLANLAAAMGSSLSACICHQICQVLNNVAQQALKQRRWKWERYSRAPVRVPSCRRRK